MDVQEDERLQFQSATLSTRPLRQPHGHVNGRKKQNGATNKNFQEPAEAEAVYNEAIQRTLEKTEVLEKLKKTVTMRSDSLAITEADFFQTLLESQEEAQRNLNELSVQLGQTRVTQQETRSAARGLPSFRPFQRTCPSWSKFWKSRRFYITYLLIGVEMQKLWTPNRYTEHVDRENAQEAESASYTPT